MRAWTPEPTTRNLTVALMSCLAAFGVSISLCAAFGIGQFEGLWTWVYYALGYAVAAAPAVLALLSIFLGTLLVVRARQIRVRPPCPCPNCSYDLTGNTSGVCPECGGRR